MSKLPVDFSGACKTLIHCGQKFQAGSTNLPSLPVVHDLQQPMQLASLHGHASVGDGCSSLPTLYFTSASIFSPTSPCQFYTLSVINKEKQVSTHSLHQFSSI